MFNRNVNAAPRDTLPIIIEKIRHFLWLDFPVVFNKIKFSTKNRMGMKIFTANVSAVFEDSKNVIKSNVINIVVIVITPTFLISAFTQSPLMKFQL